jgi:hypothetical protein
MKRMENAVVLTREEYEKLKGRGAKQPHKTSNVVLLALGLFVFMFIVAMIVIYCMTGGVPDTLIQYTLGAGGVEAAALSFIKVSKIKAGEKTGESEG